MQSVLDVEDDVNRRSGVSARSSVMVFCFHVVVPVLYNCLILFLAKHCPRLSGRRMIFGAELPLAAAEATLSSNTASFSEIGEVSESSMRVATDL